jgi:hypothetical protein
MIDATLRFIQADYASHRLRLCAEGLGLLVSVAVAILLAWTTPHPPMLLCYSLWLFASLLLVSTSHHRGSFSLTALYGSFLFIDGVGFIRTLMAL